ncbi:MAG TPA: hypothetical protein VKT51_08005 [Candidatus Eremiobacteraceae bacterium]|nr:hypothetical protein [Candidatus Eremiobacteraceae bacterium]
MLTLRFTAAIGVGAMVSALAVAPALCAPSQPMPSTAMMIPIRALVRFVNTGISAPSGTYARGAVITDEFAPFVWTTADAGTRWSTGFAAYNASSKITKPHIVLAVPTEFNVSATRAYIVFPAAFTPLLNGKPFTETGYWTFVLVKDGAVWRVASQTWAGVTFK